MLRLFGSDELELGIKCLLTLVLLHDRQDADVHIQHRAASRKFPPKHCSLSLVPRKYAHCCIDAQFFLGVLDHLCNGNLLE